jgi:putative membrane protein
MRMRWPFFCLLFVAAATVVSFVGAQDRFTWWLECIPVFVAGAVLVATYRFFRLTDFVYFWIVVHCLVLLVGGHYTYAEVPLGNWLRDLFDLSRNPYDGIGHFMQGFVPALIGRELLLRQSVMRPGKWLAALLVLGCLGISALYEILEWGVSVWTDALTGEGVWDTQKDMALAGIGATLALLLLNRAHDWALMRQQDSIS